MPALSSLYRTAFVTGSSTGLGHAFTTMLLEEGVKVWGTARDVARLSAFSEHAHFVPVALELGNGDEAVRLFQEADRAAGGFDLVINNAGYGVFSAFHETDFRVWEEQLRIMLVNTARLSHVSLGGLLARNRGALVNVSSLAAEFPLPFQSVYNVVKAGLSALNESLMIEVAGTGVAVIDLRPGDYRTDFEGSVRRTGNGFEPRQQRVWRAFEKMMKSGPAPEHAARGLRKALLRRKSGTVRVGRFFQSVAAPFLARFGSLPLRRRIQAAYFDVS